LKLSDRTDLRHERFQSRKIASGDRAASTIAASPELLPTAGVEVIEVTVPVEFDGEGA